MKNLTIHLFRGGRESVTGHFLLEEEVLTVRSEAAMWKKLREIRDQLTDDNLKAGDKVVVRTEDGTLFKDITFRRNSRGKIEMPNAVKETCRRQVEKARKAAKEAAAKAEAKKAAKREANRRYRARLKARKEAAVQEVENTAEVVEVAQVA